MNLTKNLAITAFAGLTGLSPISDQGGTIDFAGQPVAYDQSAQNVVYDNAFASSPSATSSTRKLPEVRWDPQSAPLPPDYNWLVMLAALGGAIAGFVVDKKNGKRGAWIGSTLAATLSVCGRHYLAANADPYFYDHNLTMAAEMATTFGSSILFGSILGAAIAGMNRATDFIKGQFTRTHKLEKEGNKLKNAYLRKLKEMAEADPANVRRVEDELGKLRNALNTLAEQLRKVDIRKHDFQGLQKLHELKVSLLDALTKEDPVSSDELSRLKAEEEGLREEVRRKMEGKRMDEEARRKRTYNQMFHAFHTESPFGVLWDLYNKRSTQIALRIFAAAWALRDMSLDANDNFHPQGMIYDEYGNFRPNLQIHHMSGFIAAIYSCNWAYSRLFGTNLNGMDIAAFPSIGSYKLFRVMAGDGIREPIPYNEAFYWRYIAELANTAVRTSLYGRSYWRPDLRQGIAAKRELFASDETGTRETGILVKALDATIGELYRKTPNFLGWRNVIRPLNSYAPGESLIPAKWSKWLAERSVVVTGYKGWDIMKPQFGPVGGTIMNSAYSWGTNIPIWMVSSKLVGMSWKEWGANRWIKQAGVPVWVTPVQAAFGGDTPAAQLAGFTVGLTIDGFATLVANGRYKKHHWLKDAHGSLVSFEAASTEEERNQIADHVLGDVFCRQMTDVSYSSARTFTSPYEFNPDYLASFVESFAGMPPMDSKKPMAPKTQFNAHDREIIEGIVANRMMAFERGELSSRETEGLAYLSKILSAVRLHGQPAVSQ